MKVEDGSRTVSKREVVLGTAVLLGAPFILMGAKALAEQLTQEQLKQQEEITEQQKDS